MSSTFEPGLSRGTQPQPAMRRVTSGRQHFRSRSALYVGAVAAPERLSSASHASALVLSSGSDQDPQQQLASIVLANTSASRHQRLDVPPSPPSTSGRDGDVATAGDLPSGRDQPSTLRKPAAAAAGSQRRLRGGPPGRRSLSSASFYGEYCDMAATQRIVASVWQRIMVEGEAEGQATAAPAAPTAASTATTSTAATALSVTAAAPAVPADCSGSRAVEAAGEGEAAASSTVAVKAPTGTAPVPRARGGRGVGTVALRPAAAHAAADADAAAERARDARWSVSPVRSSSSVSSAPSQRVVLYLGPEFELQMPPPPPTASSSAPWHPDGSEPDSLLEESDGGGPGASWELSEAELRASMEAPPPREVRGVNLASSQAVREVGFRGGGGGGGGSGGGPARTGGGRPKDVRSRARAAGGVGLEAGKRQQQQQQSGGGAPGAQLARQRDLVQALVERREDAVVAERIQQLASMNRSGVTAINHALQVMGDMGHVHALGRLLTLQVALGLHNEHTYATAFKCFYRAGRLGMALSAFGEACRSGRDLGPVACSALMHIATRERNLRLAWQLFDEMVAAKMTLNRYAYNSMAHLASLHGALDDVLLIYNMMKQEARAAASAARAANADANPTAAGGDGSADAADDDDDDDGNGAADDSLLGQTGSSSSSPGSDCSPDSYTYSALVRAAANGGRGDLLPALFNEMAAAQRAADRAVGRPRRLAPGEGEGRHGLSLEVWGHFISAASRSGQPDLAVRFFDAGITELGLLPSTSTYNAVLAAMARSRPLPEVLQRYREMVQGCERPIPPGMVGPDGVGASSPASSTPARRRRGPVRPNAARDSPAAAPAPAAAPSPNVVHQPPLYPDAYTFNALLTAAAHHMAPLAAVHSIRADMASHGVAINTHVGTSLINALRKTPELGRAGGMGAGGSAAAGSSSSSSSAADADAAVQAVVAEAEAAMEELVSRGAANATSYICMAALHATARRPADVLRVLRNMLRAGLAADSSAWRFLVQAAEDADQFGLVERLHAVQDRQQHMLAQQQQQQQMTPQQQQQQQGAGEQVQQQEEVRSRRVPQRL